MKTLFYQVPKIPETFNSTTEYMNAFIPSLIEETHSDMCSSLKGVARAPFCEIIEVQRINDCFKLPNDLFYLLKFKSTTTDDVEDVGRYEPMLGDVIAFTDIRPKSVNDLNRPKRYYHIAYVTGPADEDANEFPILSSKYMEMMDERDLRSNQVTKLYAVHLLNILTNILIWNALNSGLVNAERNIVEQALLPPDLYVWTRIWNAFNFRLVNAERNIIEQVLRPPDLNVWNTN